MLGFDANSNVQCGACQHIGIIIAGITFFVIVFTILYAIEYMTTMYIYYICVMCECGESSAPQRPSID